MRKIPRNLSGLQLIKELKKLDYYETRQVGSHVRLTTDKNGKHNITIPLHQPVKIGTLSNILNDIASHFKMTKEALIDILF